MAVDLDTITIADFKTRFPRDFYYKPESPSDSQYNYVLDADITNAFTLAKIDLNQDLFSTDDEITAAYLYLSAHKLVISLGASLAGMNGVGRHMVQSRGAGGVNESFAIPESFKKNPKLAEYNRTQYGQIYLSMIQTSLAGNVVSIYGGTLA